MRKCERLIAVTILCCFLPVGGGDWLTTLRAASLSTPGAARHQVEALGVGTEVEVKLARGGALEGSIGAIEADTFSVIARRDGVLRAIAYNEVAELKLVQPASPVQQGAPRLGKGLKILIGVAATAAITAVAIKTFSKHRGK